MRRTGHEESWNRVTLMITNDSCLKQAQITDLKPLSSKDKDEDEEEYLLYSDRPRKNTAGNNDYILWVTARS